MKILPGFTAEAALISSQRRYRTGGGLVMTGATAQAAKPRSSKAYKDEDDTSRMKGATKSCGGDWGAERSCGGAK